jgi:hypothetical protein
MEREEWMEGEDQVVPDTHPAKRDKCDFCKRPTSALLSPIGCEEWQGWLADLSESWPASYAWPRCTQCAVQMACPWCFLSHRYRIRCQHPSAAHNIECAVCLRPRDYAKTQDRGVFDTNLDPAKYTWLCDTCTNRHKYHRRTITIHSAQLK